MRSVRQTRRAAAEFAGSPEWQGRILRAMRNRNTVIGIMLLAGTFLRLNNRHSSGDCRVSV